MPDGSSIFYAPQDVDEILNLIRRRTGIDFGRYRPTTVHRRIVNRMSSAGLVEPAQYLRLLRDDQDEAWRLLAHLTIKVSRFFRNRPVFDFLREHLPRAAATVQRDLRIWCAGCAHGEEAYSLALLLLLTGTPGTVLATDIDPAALQRARAGRYDGSTLQELTASEIEAGFDLSPHRDGDFLARPALRNRIEFRCHDLLSNPVPESDCYDLICCRNVLIYLTPDAQSEVLTTLSASLSPGGHLCLGEAEWPLPGNLNAFDALPRQLRLFRRRPADSMALRQP